jgi:hypothetical protein
MHKRRQRIKAGADNAFTKKTGIKIVKLTGTSDCWICGQKDWNIMPVRKVSYAIHQEWEPYEINASAKRMSNLRVKQSCGVDQCVNPDHLVGKENDISPTW